MIAIIDYEAGNLASVSNALQRLDVPHRITGRTDELDAADGVIFPGVGHATPAMDALRERGLDDWLRKTAKPVLGICLGMQLLYESTEEGGNGGLGIIPGTLKRFPASAEKVPHMGWNTFSVESDSGGADHPLLEGIAADSHFYYVHSYFAPVNEYTVASCDYICEFASVVACDNYSGVQFHPEKSGEAGARLLRNFLDLVGNV